MGSTGAAGGTLATASPPTGAEGEEAGPFSPFSGAGRAFACAMRCELKRLALSLTSSFISSCFSCGFFWDFSSCVRTICSISCCILDASQTKPSFSLAERAKNNRKGSELPTSVSDTWWAFSAAR
jgi:hypothetical protein